jgi:hypothetical protein
MAKQEPLVVTYKPVIVDGKQVHLPIMQMTGLSKSEYLVLPDEYFDVEGHVLLGGVTLIPMKNDFDQTV